MQPDQFPIVTSVEVIETQPKPADLKSLNYIASEENVTLNEVAYVVRISLETLPSASAMGVALYLDDYRIRKYWGYPGGIYFKVYNPRFFRKHGGKSIRFSVDGREFHDTGVELPKLGRGVRAALTPNAAVARLPSQEDVLKG